MVAVGPLFGTNLVLFAICLGLCWLSIRAWRRRIRSRRCFFRYLARLLRCSPSSPGRDWCLRGTFRGREFAVGTIRGPRHLRPPLAIRLGQPSLMAHADLLLDLRPRSLLTHFAPMLGRPNLHFGHGHLDRCLALHCSDADLARQLRGREEFRTVLCDFWCARRRGVLRFSRGQLTYLQRRWSPCRRTAAEIRHCLFLLCDLCDLIRSREWSQGSTLLQKDFHAAEDDENAGGSYVDAGQTAGQGEGEFADPLRVGGRQPKDDEERAQG